MYKKISATTFILLIATMSCSTTAAKGNRDVVVSPVGGKNQNRPPVGTGKGDSNQNQRPVNNSQTSPQQPQIKQSLMTESTFDDLYQAIIDENELSNEFVNSLSQQIPKIEALADSSQQNDLRKIVEGLKSIASGKLNKSELADLAIDLRDASRSLSKIKGFEAVYQETQIAEQENLVYESFLKLVTSGALKSPIVGGYFRKIEKLIAFLEYVESNFANTDSKKIANNALKTYIGDKEKINEETEPKTQFKLLRTAIVEIYEKEKTSNTNTDKFTERFVKLEGLLNTLKMEEADKKRQESITSMLFDKKAAEIILQTTNSTTPKKHRNGHLHSGDLVKLFGTLDKLTADETYKDDEIAQKIKTILDADYDKKNKADIIKVFNNITQVLSLRVFSGLKLKPENMEEPSSYNLYLLNEYRKLVYAVEQSNHILNDYETSSEEKKKEKDKKAIDWLKTVKNTSDAILATDITTGDIYNAASAIPKKYSDNTNDIKTKLETLKDDAEKLITAMHKYLLSTEIYGTK